MSRGGIKEDKHKDVSVGRWRDMEKKLVKGCK